MLNKSQLLTKSKLYILAISGGPDSMFLLDNMRLGGYKFIVAHVNYQKRKESEFDEELVKQYCQKYSQTYEVYQVSGSEYNFITNFQDKARKIRYDFFQKLADKYHTKYIVVAHHCNDHLETYLLQKQRKSLVEYWGLPTRTKQGKYWVLRPLLSLNKQQIYQYLTKKKIDYAVDITNQLPIYQRNVIRQKLDNMSEKEKKNLEKEIEKKNRELKKIKTLTKIATKKLIITPSILQLGGEIEYPPEVYLRLLYSWINEATDGILQQRKKKLLNEIYKQLFISKKNNLKLDLGNHFHLIKRNNQAIIFL